MSIEADFQFSRAGQGCFYNGRIRRRDKQDFYMVHDCGSLSGIKRNLHKDIDELTSYTRHLHLLVLSHFDEDHVNQLSRLLNRIQRIDTVVIPYIMPVQRVYLAMTGSAALDADYVNFLTDPIRYITGQEANVGQIVVIRGDDDRNENQPDISPILPRDEGTFETDTPQAPIDNSDEGEALMINLPGISNQNGQISEAFGSGAAATGSPTPVSLCSHHGYLNLGKDWSFRFFNKPESPDRMRDFESDLLKILGKSVNASIQVDDLRFLVRNKSKRDELKAIYRHEFSSMNATSLMTWHGPAGVPSEIWLGSIHGYSKITGDVDEGGTMLTGDAELQEDDLYAAFSRHFRKEVSKTLVFQVPHHGSNKNWRPEFCSDFDYAQLFVINFGYGNQPRHPGQKVVDDIDKFGDRTIFQMDATQITAVNYRLEIR